MSGATARTSAVSSTCPPARSGRAPSPRRERHPAMTRYVLVRLLWVVPVVLGVSLIVFSIMKLVPGDVAQVIAGTDGTAEDVALIRQSLGLDRPVYEQYLTYLGNSLRGDFGRSAVTKRPVTEEIASRVEPTAELAIAAFVVSIVIGLPAGV